MGGTAGRLEAQHRDALGPCTHRASAARAALGMTLAPRVPVLRRSTSPRHYRNRRNREILAPWPGVPYAGAERFGPRTAEPRPSKLAMYRLTARLLLALLLAGIFVPVALAISAPVPHACCLRKPMHDRGFGSPEIQAVGGQNHNCCPPVTTAHWAEMGSGIASNIQPLLASLSPDSHPLRLSHQVNTLRPVRGPPLR